MLCRNAMDGEKKRESHKEEEKIYAKIKIYII